MKCEDNGERSLLELADLDRLDGDIFQETFPEKAKTMARDINDVGVKATTTKINDRVIRPRIMDISYLDRLEGIILCQLCTYFIITYCRRRPFHWGGEFGG